MQARPSDREVLSGPQRLANQRQEPVVVVDPAGKLLGYNSQAARLLRSDDRSLIDLQLFPDVIDFPLSPFVVNCSTDDANRPIDGLAKIDAAPESMTGESKATFELSLTLTPCDYGWLVYLRPPPSTESLSSSHPLGFRQNADTIIDAVIETDLGGCILSWNRGAEQLYGYSASEVVGKSKQLIFHPAHPHDESELITAQHSGIAIADFETTRRSRDGREFAVSVSSSPQFDDQGRVISHVTVERDIGNRRERMRDLYAAKEQAEAANRTKGEFVANISHELRTPMSAILGMLDLARRHPQMPAAVHDYLATAHDAARSMLSLVNDLLDFSRLDAGKMEINNVSFRLRDTMDEVMQFLALRARDHNLEFGCNVRADVPDVLYGDPRRFRQIVLNLVGNAIKFTPQGEVMVHVVCDELREQRVKLHLSVHDTGIGIPAELHERIFEPFMQVDSSDTRIHGGSGLGLAISRKISELIGAQLWCEPNTPHGTIFHLRVPFGVLQSGPPLPDSTRNQLGGLSALVLEGHSSTREMLRELLTNWGMKPKVAQNPVELGIQIFEGTRDSNCDLMILDASLRDASGDLLLSRLSQSPLSEKILLLVPSGDIAQVKAAVYRKSQIDAFIEKPISQSDLLQAIVRSSKGLAAEGRATWIAPINRIGRSYRILLAEDTHANQKVVQTILKLRGHFVEIADNGQQAVAMARQNSYDVILMDLRMPILNGIEAARQIRQLPDPQKASVPIVALTAHVLDADRERCFDAGMNDYVTKPIDADDLVRIVENSVDDDSLSSVPSLTSGTRRKTSSRLSSASPPEPADGSRKVIDVEKALSRIGNSEPLLRQLAHFFLQDVPTLGLSLAQALNEKNADEALRAAHTIKGLAANFDASDLQDTAAQIERLVRENKLHTAKELYDRLTHEIQSVNKALRQQVLKEK